jgi:uncharacterized protein YndB with AHSA1/START domain
MKNTCTVQIEAPIEKVFDLIQDPEKHKLWVEELEETTFERDYDPENPLGAKFTQKIREGKEIQVYHGQFIAFKKPSRLGVRLVNKGLSVHVEYRLKALKKLTRVDFTSEITFKSALLRAMAQLSGPFVRSLLQKQMDNLKELAETQN